VQYNVDLMKLLIATCSSVAILLFLSVMFDDHSTGARVGLANGMNLPINSGLQL